MSGTTPPGVKSEQQAAQWVREMFGQVAPRYDLLNHLLSFNIDRLWRARTVKRVRPVLDRQGARVLDLCCGTGDLAIALQKATKTSHVLGSDFCHPMLTAAQHKGLANSLFEADALCLPLADASLDLITVAFGFRNFANYEKGLSELRRVLRPGGMAAILEFSQPPNVAFASLYGFYSRNILPRLGGALSGSKDAYSYLPESVRKFPGAEELAQKMGTAGFAAVEFERMTFGIVALHLGRAQ
ncbi:MAG: bifunctional demethylmenaquinone methyltransferase/2-methoxy-6-polyprenyl-1,4-benzoquinol methylase UbiE [Bryobacteraceae bacterium]